MQLEKIVTDADGREITERGTPLFPLSVHENDMYAFPAHFVPWHWHEEFEIIRVTAGSLLLEIPNAKTVIREGEGAVIGSNTLHAMYTCGDRTSRMNTTVFAPEIIGGAAASVFQSKYVLPLVQNGSFTVFHFSRGHEDTDKFLELLTETERLHTDKTFGYEFRLRNCLSEIWLLMLAQHDIQPAVQQPADDAYIRRMLLFIHENYAQPLTLQDIAASANISCRTATRSFRQQVNRSIFEYLQEYRIRKAAEQLFMTEDSVTEIALAAGFPDPSYFTRRFRMTTGLTPRDYRRMAKTSGAPAVFSEERSRL